MCNIVDEFEGKNQKTMKKAALGRAAKIVIKQ